MTRSVGPTSEPQAEDATAPKDVAPAAALGVGTSDIRTLLTRNLRTSGIYIAFVVVVALFAILTGGTSLSPGNITNIILQYSYILILAIGMVIVIIAGHIDLSVGSVVAVTGATSAVLVIRNDQPWWVGVLAALARGSADRCLARVLGRLRRHPRLHRHPGRHAAVPRPHAAGAQQRLAVPVHPGVQQDRLGLQQRAARAATGTTRSPC